MQHFRSLLYLLIGVSSPLLTLAKQEEPVVALAARGFDYIGRLPRRVVLKDLGKKKSPEEACGVNYVLCDTTSCCEKGRICSMRPSGWYCPATGDSSFVVPVLAVASLDSPSPTATPTLIILGPPSPPPTPTATPIILGPTPKLGPPSPPPDEPTTTTIIVISDINSPSITYSNKPSQTSDSTSPTDGTVEDVTVKTKKKKGGLGTGAMIGIIVAVVVILIIAAVAAFLIIRSKKQKEAKGPQMQATSGYMQPQQQSGVPPPEDPRGAGKEATRRADYYQPGRNGAVEAMSIPITAPAPTPAPQAQAQPPIYEL